MSPDMIRQLPEGRALVVRGGLAPTVAKLPRAWKSRPYRQARRRGLAIAQLAPAPSAVTTPAPRTPQPGPQPDLAGAAAAVGSTRPHLRLVIDDPDTQIPDGRDTEATDEEALPPGDYPWSPR
jgi:hypothetical protein